MSAKTKTFDCVEFKRQIQRRLREEYEARADEFDSYVDFINAKVREDQWAREMWAKFAPPHD